MNPRLSLQSPAFAGLAQLLMRRALLGVHLHIVWSTWDRLPVLTDWPGKRSTIAPTSSNLSSRKPKTIKKNLSPAKAGLCKGRRGFIRRPDHGHWLRIVDNSDASVACCSQLVRGSC